MVLMYFSKDGNIDTTKGQSPYEKQKTEDFKMVNYNEAKARAWEHFEGGERITKAIITWVDA